MVFLIGTLDGFLQFGKNYEQPIEVVKRNEEAANSSAGCNSREISGVQFFEDAIEPEHPIELKCQENDEWNVPHGDNFDRNCGSLNSLAFVEPLATETALLCNGKDLFAAVTARLLSI